MADEVSWEVQQVVKALDRIDLKSWAFGGTTYELWVCNFDDRLLSGVPPTGCKPFTSPFIRVRLCFKRPDTNTGAMGIGYSRWEQVDPTDPDGVIKTFFLLAKLIAEHETMEAFKVDGERVFNPHRSIAAHVDSEKIAKQWARIAEAERITNPAE